MPTFHDKTGLRFGRLVVVERRDNTQNNMARWLCRCDCGKQTVVISASLQHGHTQSCGCLNRESLVTVNSTHKRSRTPIYRVWATMLQRCNNPKNANYKYYGGRNIKVCSRWLIFENFLKDMGERPKGTSIDRINNNGNYEPGNCRWSNASKQMKNRRPNWLTRKRDTNGRFGA